MVNTVHHCIQSAASKTNLSYKNYPPQLLALHSREFFYTSIPTLTSTYSIYETDENFIPSSFLTYWASFNILLQEFLAEYVACHEVF